MYIINLSSDERGFGTRSTNTVVSAIIMTCLAIIAVSAIALERDANNGEWTFTNEWSSTTVRVHEGGWSASGTISISTEQTNRGVRVSLDENHKPLRKALEE